MVLFLLPAVRWCGNERAGCPGLLGRVLLWRKVTVANSRETGLSDSPAGIAFVN